MNSPFSRRLLLVTPWESMWSLAEGAGVSDEQHFFTGLLRAGWTVDVLAPEGDGRREFDAIALHTYPNFFADMDVCPRPVKRLTWLPLFQAMVAPRALRLVRELRPDVVLGLSYYTAPVGWLCRRRHGVPAAVKLFGVMDLVHTEWSAARYRFKNAEQLAAIRFPQDAWIVLDDGTRGAQVLAQRGVPTERIHFLPNGVDVSWIDRRPDRDAARARFDLPARAPVILFLARFVASKRPTHPIRALPAVATGSGEAPLLVFAGDGPERPACEALARSLGLADRVRFPGVVPHDDVPELMAAADVFVTTSNLTNMALPTCEALMCGVPVVAYDVGDAARLVRPGETGALVPDGDVAALARALTAVLGDASDRAAMAQAARRVARDELTGWDDRIAMEIEILESLAARGVWDA